MSGSPARVILATFYLRKINNSIFLVIKNYLIFLYYFSLLVFKKYNHQLDFQTPSLTPIREHKT